MHRYVRLMLRRRYRGWGTH